MDNSFLLKKKLENKEIALRLYEKRLNAIWEKILEQKKELDQQKLDIDHQIKTLEALKNNQI